MKKCISILGSTGSIGTQTIDVVRNLGWHICALAAHSNIELLEEQIRKFQPQLVSVYDENAALTLKGRIADTGTKVLSGMDGLCEAARLPSADLVLNAIVGIAGLQPTLAA
ncbi:MAG TPA: 1-deoxy-D-xylulose-5-phosphate reductoisomerase, partial [Ruminococcaceae bacterium]|nr:1-deoxy-D-xylulose-5-phosphate reductoisomerase [Oscillospiraceae bacterium]